MILPAFVGAPLAALVYVVPGLLFVARKEWERADVIELAAVACAHSVAWWAAGIWLIGFVSIPLSAFAVASVGGALVALGILRRREMVAVFRTWRENRGPSLLAIAVVLFVFATRGVFAATRFAASVGDMSAHAYMAELVVMRNGLPDTYDPFLPIGEFGAFPPGFHALAAIETLLSGAPTYRSTLHVLCFSLAALTLATVALLRALGVGRAGATFGAVAALMLARNPQFFAQWGGAPTLLSTALVFMVMRELVMMAESDARSHPLRFGFLAAGTLLVHQVPAASFVYLLPAAVAICAGRRRQHWLRVLRGGAFATIIAVLLTLPFLVRAPIGISPGVETWARDWFQYETHSAAGLQDAVLRRLGLASSSGQTGPCTWPFFVVVYLGVLPALLLVFGLATRWVRERGTATAMATMFVVAHLILFTGAVTEMLPFWPALYPTRSAVWLAPALAIALAGLASWVMARAPRRVVLAAVLIWLGAFALEGIRMSPFRFGSAFYGGVGTGRTSLPGIALNEAAWGAFWITTFNRDNAVLTRDDLRAFDWIRENTPPNAIFGANYGDGGTLLAAIARRPVVDAHFNLAFLYPSEIKRWRETPPEYVYVASEPSPAHSRKYVPEILDQNSRLALVFRAGNARVYKVK